MAKRGLHFAYGALLFLAFIFTLVATFTPGWRSYKGDGAPNLGLVSRFCGSGTRQVNDYDCRRWAGDKMPFEKAALAFMIIACLLEFIALGCFFALFSPRIRLAMPAFTVTALAFLSVFAALLAYGLRYDYKIAYLQSVTFELLANAYLGYSYWIAVVAAFFLLLASACAGGMFGQPIDDHLH